MKKYAVQLTPEANQDLKELYDFLLQFDYSTAERALETIIDSFQVLSKSPYICRKAGDGSNGSLIRELIIDFGASGYIALFEIEDDQTVTITAVRHQRESDYH